MDAAISILNFAAEFNPMAKQGPIVIVEDDLDDQEIMSYVLDELQISNQIIFFNACEEALNYLRTTSVQPFIIVSDINLPLMNGFEFKQKIDDDPELRKKSIPFIFLSTSTNLKEINKAYTELTVQGFFKKTESIEELKSLLNLIINYWKACTNPKSVSNTVLNSLYLDQSQRRQEN